jgi:heme/copper-type cytochrome/quinol oxidase subunit 2
MEIGLMIMICLVVLAITVWFVRQAAKKPGEK